MKHKRYLTFIYLFFLSFKIYAVCELVVGPNKINIKMLDKSQVLQALYNAAVCPFTPHMYDEDDTLTLEEATKIINENHGQILAVNGRLIKVNLDVDVLDAAAYNRMYGLGAAERAICKHLHNFKDHYPNYKIQGAIQGACGFSPN